MEPLPGSGTGNQLIAMVLAGVALLLGAAGVWFGYSASQTAAKLKTQIAAETGSAAKSVSALQSELEAIRTEIKAVNDGLDPLKTRSRLDREAAQRAIAELAEEIARSREQINANTEAIAAIPEQLAKFRPSAPAVSSGSTSAGATAATAAPVSGDALDAASNRIHTIQSGDTFAKLANLYGVPLSRIQSANPTVNPSRLQIGQKVVIPSSN